MTLSSDEQNVWNELDKVVGRLLKARGDFAATEAARINAAVAAELRDRIADPRWESQRKKYIAEAREALATGEWWNSSVLGSGGGDE